MGVRIEISESTFARLQAMATPLVDTVDAVIIRLLDEFPKQEVAMSPTSEPANASQSASGSTVESINKKVLEIHMLKGFQKEVWHHVIDKMPFDRFTLRDVYERMTPLAELRPHVKELKASIRAALEKLRDRGLIEFVDNRGTYRRLARTPHRDLTA